MDEIYASLEANAVNEIFAIGNFFAYCRQHPTVKIVAIFFNGKYLSFCDFADFDFNYRHFTVYPNPYYERNEEE